MKSMKLLTVLFAMLLVSGNAFAASAAAPAGDAAPAQTLSVRSFQFKHKEADKAAAIIKPLMTPEGSLSIQPGANVLVVTDKAENLKAIEKALTAYDVPAQPFKISVRLVAASREAAGRVPDELRDVAPKMAALKFNAFDSLGEANFEGREGEPGIVDIGNGYRADFRLGEFDPASGTVRVSDFRLSKQQQDQLVNLLKTSLNVKLGQTVILGASKVPQSERALMIVISARR